MNPFEPQLLRALSWPGPGELLLILLIVLVVFGHNRIPQLGDALGKGIRNFRKSFAGKDEEAPKPSGELSDGRPPSRTDSPVEQKTGDANKVL